MSQIGSLCHFPDKVVVSSSYHNMQQLFLMQLWCFVEILSGVVMLIMIMTMIMHLKMEPLLWCQKIVFALYRLLYKGSDLVVIWYHGEILVNNGWCATFHLFKAQLNVSGMHYWCVGEADLCWRLIFWKHQHQETILFSSFILLCDSVLQGISSSRFYQAAQIFLPHC